MLANKNQKCTPGDYHLFDILKKKKDIRCRCGQNKGTFDYITSFNLTMRVRIKNQTDFRGVN